jgi:hypothetical protein
VIRATRWFVVLMGGTLTVKRHCKKRIMLILSMINIHA